MVTKYDGKVLISYNGAIPDYGADRYYVNFSGQLFEVSVSNLDSGWGDNYTPTADEIKAYFMGWKMYDTANGATTSVYNGTAGQSKGWVRRRLTDGSLLKVQERYRLLKLRSIRRINSYINSPRQRSSLSYPKVCLRLTRVIIRSRLEGDRASGECETYRSGK